MRHSELLSEEAEIFIFPKDEKIFQNYEAFSDLVRLKFKPLEFAHHEIEKISENFLNISKSSQINKFGEEDVLIEEINKRLKEYFQAQKALLLINSQKPDNINLPIEIDLTLQFKMVQDRFSLFFEKIAEVFFAKDIREFDYSFRLILAKILRISQTLKKPLSSLQSKFSIDNFELLNDIRKGKPKDFIHYLRWDIEYLNSILTEDYHSELIDTNLMFACIHKELKNPINYSKSSILNLSRLILIRNESNIYFEIRACLSKSSSKIENMFVKSEKVFNEVKEINREFQKEGFFRNISHLNLPECIDLINFSFKFYKNVQDLQTNFVSAKEYLNSSSKISKERFTNLLTQTLKELRAIHKYEQTFEKTTLKIFDNLEEMIQSCKSHKRESKYLDDLKKNIHGKLIEDPSNPFLRKCLEEFNWDAQMLGIPKIEVPNLNKRMKYLNDDRKDSDSSDSSFERKKPKNNAKNIMSKFNF